MNRTVLSILWSLTTLFTASSASAAPCASAACIQSIAVDGKSVTEARDIVLRAPGKQSDVKSVVKTTMQLAAGTIIEAPKRVRLSLVTSNGNTLHVTPGSRLRIEEVGKRGERFTQLWGSVGYAVENALNFFDVLHDTFTASVKGTEFTVEIDSENNEIEYGWVHGEVVVEHEVIVKVAGAKGLKQDGEDDEDGEDERTYTERDVLSESHKELRYRLGPDQYIKEFKSYRDAEEFFRAQLAEDEKSGDPQRIQLGLTGLGTVLNVIGKPKAALKVVKRALDLATANGNEKQQARTARQLGLIYRAMRNYSASTATLRRWLALEEKREGPSSLAVARAYTALGRTAGMGGDARGWVDGVERAMAIHKQLDPSEQELSTAMGYKNLADAWRAAKDPAKALQYYTASLALKRKLEPRGMNASIANSLRDLGLLHLQMGEHAVGIDYLQQALQGRIALFSNEHPSVAVSHEDLGNAFAVAGDRAKALESFGKAQELRLQLFPGGVHPSVARTYRAMAQVQRDAGDKKAAADYESQARKIHKQLPK